PILLMAGAARAAHVWEDPSAWWGGHWVYETTDKYTPNELSFDMFGSYVHGEHHLSNLFDTNIRHNGFWGGGVGLNYFFTHELGLGADINIPDNGHNFIDQVEGSLIARWPFEPSGFAPYIFGGGGRATDPRWEWTGHAGVGLEYRFN